MLSHIETVDALRGLARLKARDYVTRTVHPREADSYLEEGWEPDRSGTRSVRLRRAKPHSVLLEDHVWSLLYRMGFGFLSAEGGALLDLDHKNPESPTNQIDVVAIDDEVVLAVECKSARKPSKRPEFQEELAKFAQMRPQFARAVAHQYPAANKRHVVLAMFLSNILLSDNDRIRAQSANVVLFDEQDLLYYEELVRHLGPAARYQFLADMLPGKPIAGLELRLPAIRAKMGGHTCYTFSISPSYLLKIGYVSHRAKGKASDVNAYQRMIKKYRLQSLRSYIDDDGIFPTNIVLNLDKKPQFDRQAQEGDAETGVMGWLTLRSAYKSAWIIDGQHRLFAYSGHRLAQKARLSVLAFESLPEDKQAQLFIDINAEQKSVKQSLLLQLYAELHWSSTDPEARVRAAISKAIETLDRAPESPFFQRILWADGKKDAARCISLTSISRALEASELYIAPMRKEGITEYGPLWGGENEATRKRTAFVLKHWFGAIRSTAPDWWDAGSADGGGLAMNDAVVSCIQTLRSVCLHLAAGGVNLLVMRDQELVDQIRPYSDAVAAYLGSLTAEERKRFRDLRGVQGQTTRTRRCQLAIHERIPPFMPTGLKKFLATHLAQTNPRAEAIIADIKAILQGTVFDELKREFGTDETQWWTEGVPRSIRAKIAKRREDDNGRLGSREAYFDFLDYRMMIQENWPIFGQLLGNGKANSSKAKRTAWIGEVNEVHKIVSNPSAGRSVSLDQLEQMESYHSWLEKQISGDSSDLNETA